MIDDIRWLQKADGSKVLQANDMHVWFDIPTVIEESAPPSPDAAVRVFSECNVYWIWDGNKMFIVDNKNVVASLHRNCSSIIDEGISEITNTPAAAPIVASFKAWQEGRK